MTDVFKGATDQTIFVELVDSTTGLPKTGIVYTDVTGSYSRTRSARVAITMATLASASAAHGDGGFILVDDTNQPGVYRVDIPDAAFATGASEVVCTFKATGCRTVSRSINLVNINNQVAYVPNAAADAAGGLPISDAGGLDLDAKLANTNEVTAARMGALTDWINGGRLDLILDIIAQDTTTDIPALISALNNLSAAQVTAAVPTTAQIAAAVDVALINTGDGSDLLQAIANQIAADWVAGDASPLAIVTAMKNDATIAQMIARIDAATTSRMASYTQPAGFLAATFPSTVASPTNITQATGVVLSTAGVRDIFEDNWFGITFGPDTSGYYIQHIHEQGETTLTKVTSIEGAVADLPTNSELATALAAADDAVLAAINALENLSAAEVNAEVLDVLNVDTFGELAAPPAASSTLRDKLTWLFMWARNRSSETATQRKLYADNASTVVSTEVVSDDGTTFEKGEAA